MSILSVKNLSKSFGKLEVLNDISFNVEQGEVISIIGRREAENQRSCAV